MIVAKSMVLRTVLENNASGPTITDYFVESCLFVSKALVQMSNAV